MNKKRETDVTPKASPFKSHSHSGPCSAEKTSVQTCNFSLISFTWPLMNSHLLTPLNKVMFQNSKMCANNDVKPVVKKKKKKRKRKAKKIMQIETLGLPGRGYLSPLIVLNNLVKLFSKHLHTSTA